MTDLLLLCTCKMLKVQNMKLEDYLSILLFKSIVFSQLFLIIYIWVFSTFFLLESSSILSPMVDILMKLFRKMIDVDQPFHLTLVSVCFSNLKDLPSSKKGSIGFYLKQVSPPSGSGKRVRVSWKILKTICR